MTPQDTPQGEKPCKLIMDHNIAWSGDGYYCSKCMREFRPVPTKTNQKPSLLELPEEEQIAIYTKAANNSAKAMNKVIADYEAKTNQTGEAMNAQEIIYDCIKQLRYTTSAEKLAPIAPVERAQIVIDAANAIRGLLELDLKTHKEGDKSSEPTL